MYRSHPNAVPVANKYLAHKSFLKEQDNHKNNIKNIHGLLDQSTPAARPHCTQRLRQKQVKEHELELIDHENERLRARMTKNGAFVDSHNDYAMHSLNMEKRNREERQHRNEFERLQKQVNHARTNYPKQNYQHDYDKQQDFKRRISRFPSENNK